jgi:hypothetical protein
VPAEALVEVSEPFLVAGFFVTFAVLDTDDRARRVLARYGACPQAFQCPNFRLF